MPWHNSRHVSKPELIKSLYAAFAHGDVPVIIGSLDPNIEWHEAENFIYAGDTTLIGPQDVLTEVFMPLGTEWSNFSVTPEQFIGGGDTIVARGRYRGTYKANSVSVDTQFAHVFEIANSKVVRFRQYTDTYQFKQAVARVAAGA